VVRESSEPGRRRLDPAGMALGAALLAAVNFAFVAGSVLMGVLAAALLTAFLLLERRRPDPMLPLGLFGRSGFSAANAVAGAMNLGTLGLLFVLTLFLQRVQDRSALAAGLALLPLLAPLSVLAPVAGRLTARAGPPAPMAAGLLIASGGVGLLTALHSGSAYPMLVPGLLLWGIGMGVLTPAVVAAAMRAVPATWPGWPQPPTTPPGRRAAPSGSPRSARWPAIPPTTGSSRACTWMRSSPPACSSRPR
jgi:MFS transporter, DHA2 family, methylenomycin A resistance protein